MWIEIDPHAAHLGALDEADQELRFPASDVDHALPRRQLEEGEHAIDLLRADRIAEVVIAMRERREARGVHAVIVSPGAHEARRRRSVTTSTEIRSWLSMVFGCQRFMR